MKKFKKLLAILLVASMIFTTNAVNVFAEGNKANQEEQLNEETTVGTELGDPEEETTVGANVHGARPEDEENSTGAKLGEPEEDIDMDENLSEPEDDTRKGERLSEPALEEEPEAEAEEDLKLNDKKKDELYGDPAKSLLSIEVSKYTITTYYVGDTYDTTDLEIRAYYDDESYETISYTGNEDKFTFNPDYVHNPFTEATTGDDHLEMEMTYTESENSADATILLQVRETPSTPTTYTIKYDKNLPSGYTISTSMTWYTDSTSDDLSSNPIKISGSAGMTCENADGYVRKLEAWNTLADKSGTPYMFAENISSPAAFTSNPLTLYAVWGDPVVPTPGTDKFYIISYGNPTEYPNEKKIFAFDSTTTVEEMENFVANNISKCINPSGKAANGFYNMEELIPVGADDTQVRQILNDNYDLTKEKSRTLDKIVVWFEDYIPDPMGTYLGITFEGSTPPGPTPPGPTPPSPGGGGTGGGSGGGSSDPTHGPMGDLTKNPLYANALNNIAVNTANNIPQTSLLNNNGLYVQLKSMQENANTSFNNAKDAFGNTGYGQWLRVPNSTTWYFYAGDLNQVNGQQTQGFLSNGWFNLGWDGQDRWYHFDTSGVMQLGWYQEAGKTYFLQNDLNDNWYGKAVTGTQNIGGRVYNFDSTGALIN